MSESLLARTLAHLERLVAFDTRNPPRNIDGEGIFAYLRGELAEEKMEGRGTSRLKVRPPSGVAGKLSWDSRVRPSWWPWPEKVNRA